MHRLCENIFRSKTRYLSCHQPVLWKYNISMAQIYKARVLPLSFLAARASSGHACRNQVRGVRGGVDPADSGPLQTTTRSLCCIDCIGPNWRTRNTFELTDVVGVDARLNRWFSQATKYILSPYKHPSSRTPRFFVRPRWHSVRRQLAAI